MCNRCRAVVRFKIRRIYLFVIIRRAPPMTRTRHNWSRPLQRRVFFSRSRATTAIIQWKRRDYTRVIIKYTAYVYAYKRYYNRSRSFSILSFFLSFFYFLNDDVPPPALEFWFSVSIHDDCTTATPGAGWLGCVRAQEIGPRVRVTVRDRTHTLRMDKWKDCDECSMYL